MVADYLSNYVTYQLYLLQSESGGDNAETGSDEAGVDVGIMDEKQAKTALDNLKALFAWHDEFSDHQAAKAFLATATSRKDPSVLSMLWRWTDEIVGELFPGGAKAYLTSATIQELSEQIRPYTTTVPGASVGCSSLQCSPWPFVKLVR